ncbi:MAG: hypothetical protein ABIL39_07070 [candidate division WOR-3 bacterium]
MIWNDNEVYWDGVYQKDSGFTEIVERVFKGCIGRFRCGCCVLMLGRRIFTI